MRIAVIGSIVPVLLFASALPTLAAPRIHRGPTSTRLVRQHAHAVAKPVAARIMDADRATQIQSALITRGYLTGAPTGAWDEPTQAAMAKLQADNGWQTKLVPDSRAIIKLGLGPSASPATSQPAATADQESATPLDAKQ